MAKDFDILQLEKQMQITKGCSGYKYFSLAIYVYVIIWFPSRAIIFIVIIISFRPY